MNVAEQMLDLIQRTHDEAVRGQRDFPVWKTVRLGTGLKTLEDFRTAFEAAKMELREEAEYLLSKPEFTVAQEPIEVDLVKVSVAEFGFDKVIRLHQLYSRAREYRLELCPAEVGPQLRLQYTDQPDGMVFVAMKDIRDSHDLGCIFLVSHKGAPYPRTELIATMGYPEEFFSLYCEFVFILPRNK